MNQKIVRIIFRMVYAKIQFILNVIHVTVHKGKLPGGAQIRREEVGEIGILQITSRKKENIE